VFRLYKGPGSIGWSTDELGPEDYTVINLYLDITPVRLPQPLYGPWAPANRGTSPAATERDGSAQ